MGWMGDDFGFLYLIFLIIGVYGIWGMTKLGYIKIDNLLYSYQIDTFG